MGVEGPLGGRSLRKSGGRERRRGHGVADAVSEGPIPLPPRLRISRSFALNKEAGVVAGFLMLFSRWLQRDVAGVLVLAGAALAGEGAEGRYQPFAGVGGLYDLVY